MKVKSLITLVLICMLVFVACDCQEPQPCPTQEPCPMPYPGPGETVEPTTEVVTAEPTYEWEDEDFDFGDMSFGSGGGKQTFSWVIANRSTTKNDSEVWGTLSTDTINEYTSAAGVTIDGLTIKDGGIGESFTVSGDFTVTGASALNGGITADTDAFVVADTTGNTTITTGTLTVGGAAALNGGITADTNAFIVADTTGNTTITTGTLTVGGNSTLASADVGGGFGSTGCTMSAAGVLQCDGAATIGGAVVITGATTQQAAVTVNANLDADSLSTLAIDSDSYYDSTGDMQINDNVVITGTTTHSGTVYLEGNRLDLDADNDTSITADTDDQIDFEIAGQDSISFTQSASYFLMDVYLRFPTLEKTASYTLTTYESGAMVNNKGATGEITITLPAATSGLGYCWGVYAAYTVTIAPDASDLIYHLTNSAGDRLQNVGTAGDSVCLYALDGIDWFPMQEIGTWSDAN